MLSSLILHMELLNTVRRNKRSSVGAPVVFGGFLQHLTVCNGLHFLALP